jgi:Tfp pilus assembly protein PilP
MRALPFCLILLLLAAAAPALAQAPAQSPPAPEAPPAEAPSEGTDTLPAELTQIAPADREAREAAIRETDPQPGQYQYLPAGRRDPFVSLLVNVGPSTGPKTRPPGMAGFLIQELALKGIVKDAVGFIALLQAPDGKTYFPKVGQRFYDGVLVAMDAATVTFRQEVTDPLSPVKTREVKKSLYPSEEARQ